MTTQLLIGGAAILAVLVTAYLGWVKSETGKLMLTGIYNAGHGIMDVPTNAYLGKIKHWPDTIDKYQVRWRTAGGVNATWQYTIVPDSQLMKIQRFRWAQRRLAKHHPIEFPVIRERLVREEMKG